MTTTHKAEISGYKVDLEVWDENGEARSKVYVEDSEGRVSSLDKIQGTGTIGDWEDEAPMPGHITRSIERWALARGY